ncbi:MAG: hypothetical protein F4Z47_03375, partial [Rhodospirillaceae bacterium]|nr:hypothetical protein [Rhodospirillaceae bacterium]
MSGDLYLRPANTAAAGHGPATLFIGTERGFTYRLTLTPSDRDAAQILIRNAAVLPDAAVTAAPLAGIGDLERRLQAPVQPGAAPGADAADGYFRIPSATPPSGNGGQAQPAVPARMIETFELKDGRQSSATDPRSGPGSGSGTGPELVADAVAKPVSAWLPAGAHAEAVVLAGVDASAGISSQGDPRPVLMRITGPAWTAAEDGTALQVDIDGCTVTGAAHGDLSSEKVYVRFRTMT